MKKIAPLFTALAVASIGGYVIAKKGEVPATTITLASAKSDIDRVSGTARQWAQSTSDIEADPSVAYGTLSNGMRYVIKRNALPEKRVSMRLHVDAGSLNETEDQRGVAHFLEHMVFNGTKHFPDATKLIPQMQRLGIAFGAHANAYTSFDETVYMLDLPNIEKSTLDLAFTVMGDFADGALLTDAEIDEERGVISSEKTSRDSVGLRMFEKQFRELLPNSRVAKRLPIGTDEVIANAPRERFVDFYTRFYTPEKMTFVYVGDIDVAAAEQRIQDVFGGVKNPAKAGAKATLGDITTKKGFQTAVFTDEELTSTDVSFIHSRPHDYKVDSKAKRQESLKMSIANAIVSRRFSRLTKQEDTKITQGGASHSIFFREMEFGSLEVSALNNDWKAALPILENEFRRAIEHGFTRSEYDEVVASIVNSYEQQVKKAATRKSDAIASSLAQHIHQDAVYSTPETDLAILNENLKSIDPNSAHASFVEFWNTEDITLVLSTQNDDKNSKKELTNIFQQSRKTTVEAPVDKDAGKFAYTDFGKAGSVTSEKHIKDLDIYQITLSNGIKVNLKKTDFDKNSISMIARFGTGKAGMPKDKPGLDSLTGAIFSAGGLSQHSTEDLKSLLAGHNVGVGLGIADDSFTLSGGTTPDDLTLQLQMLCAYLTDPGFRPEAERQFKAMLPQIFAQLKHTEQGPMSEMMGWFHGNDSRFTFPTMEQAQALTTEDVKAWLMPQLNNCPIELSIVGDFDKSTLITALNQTIGALPSRTGSNQISDEQRSINLPETPVEKVYNYQSNIEKAIAVVLWKSEDILDRDIKKVRRAGILSEILSDRMRVELREKLGEAYSPGATSSMSETFKNVGYLLAYSPVKPDKVDKVGKIIVELADKLASEGATQDELDRALTPRIGVLKKSLRQNSYWLGSVLDHSQVRPDKLEAARNRDADYAAITLEEINVLAKKYFGKNNSIRIQIAPAK